MPCALGLPVPRKRAFITEPLKPSSQRGPWKVRPSLAVKRAAGPFPLGRPSRWLVSLPRLAPRNTFQSPPSASTVVGVASAASRQQAKRTRLPAVSRSKPGSSFRVSGPTGSPHRALERGLGRGRFQSRTRPRRASSLTRRRAAGAGTVRERADQPAVLAAGGLLRLPHGLQPDLEVVPQLAPHPPLDLRQARGVEARARHVAQLRPAGLVLDELQRVQVVEDRVVHVEGRQRDAPPRAAHQELLLAPGDLLERRPRQLAAPLRVRLRQAHVVARAIADQGHGQVVEAGADHLAEALGVRLAELDVAVGRVAVEQLGLPALARQHNALGVPVPAVHPAAEHALQQPLLRQVQALAARQQAAQRHAPALARPLEELRQLQRRGRIRVEHVRAESLDGVEVLGQALRRQVVAGEHQPAACGVVAADRPVRPIAGHVPADHHESGPVEVAAPPPVRSQEGLILRTRHALLEDEAHRHAGGASGRDVEARGGADGPRAERSAVLQQVLLREQRAAGQVLQSAEARRVEPGLLETLPVERAVEGGVLQHLAQALELVLLRLGRRPALGLFRQAPELREASAHPPGLWQAAVGRAQAAPDRLRQVVVEAQQGVELVLEAHPAAPACERPAPATATPSERLPRSMAPTQPKWGRKAKVALIASKGPFQAGSFETTITSSGPKGVKLGARIAKLLRSSGSRRQSKPISVAAAQSTAAGWAPASTTPHGTGSGAMGPLPSPPMTPSTTAR